LLFERTTQNKRTIFLLTALFLSPLATCGIPRPPQEVAISRSADFRPSDATQIHSVNEALAAIIKICRDDLHLPVVDPVTVHLYSNSSSYAFYGYGHGIFPIDVANHVASAKGNEILIDLGKIDKRRAFSILLLAHEYGHVIHHEIAGDAMHSAFVAEGFADWVAARVLHSLGWQDYDVSVHRAEREVLRQWEWLPEIRFVLDNASWARTMNQFAGTVRTYDMAFLTVDRIMKRNGQSGVISFATNSSFGDALGISAEEFDAALKKSLRAAAPTNADFSFSPPKWKIGDQWTYARKNLGARQTVVKEVVGEERFHGFKVFVVRSGDEEKLYGKNGLGLMATRRDGRVTFESDSVLPFFFWPLEPGKESRMRFTVWNAAAHSSSLYSLERVVTGMEPIRVAAGVFGAVKIEAYARSTGGLRAEYWYAPEVKWFVKIRVYGDMGIEEEELIKTNVLERPPH
jgi:hypothetical protein